MSLRSVVSILALFAGTVSFTQTAQAQEWKYTRTISIPPPYAPVFADTTPSGDVVVTTFNNRAEGETDLPVILIHQPLSANPGFYVVCRNRFPAMRGYSGLAVGNDGTFYVSADSGEHATSWIRKFKPNGQLDPAFGNGGEVRPGLRVLGLDVVGDKLITTFAFGSLAVMDRNTARLAGPVQAANEKALIRDVIVDPATQMIYGVAQGAAWVWSGGTLDNPGAYKLRRLSQDKMPEPRAGEGIFFDPVTRSAVIPFAQTKTLLTIDGGGRVSPSAITGTTEDVRSIADAVLLTDGNTMFVTDSTTANNGRCGIHVMTRQAVDAAMDTSSTPNESLTSIAAVSTETATREKAPPPAATPTAMGASPWVRDVRAGFAKGRAGNKPIVVYARSEKSERCATLEQSVLPSPEVAAALANYVPIYFDVLSDTKLSQELGIFRVPNITVYSPNGERKGVVQGRFEKQALLNLLTK